MSAWCLSLMTSIEGSFLLGFIQTVTLILLAKNKGSQLLLHDGEACSYVSHPSYQIIGLKLITLVLFFDNMAITSGFVHMLSLPPAHVQGYTEVICVSMLSGTLMLKLNIRFRVRSFRNHSFHARSKSVV